MAARRTKSISAKVTEAEYTQLVAQAGKRTVSEWVRTTVLAAVSPPASELIAFLRFAEQLGQRSIVLHLCHLLSQGQPVTRDVLLHLIDQADRTKIRLAAGTDRRRGDARRHALTKPRLRSREGPPY